MQITIVIKYQTEATLDTSKNSSNHGTRKLIVYSYRHTLKYQRTTKTKLPAACPIHPTKNTDKEKPRYEFIKHKANNMF